MKSSPQDKDRVVIIGGGPAGLTAAYQLCKADIPSLVLEKDQIVGGISRTATYKGYHFDIGGHRFFTKVSAVEELWHEVMDKEDFLLRSRMSRIFYAKKFFHYPLRATNALLGLGVFNSFLVLLSYIKARVAPIHPERSFEDWVSNRFGRRLFRIFFETYTEKVWGIPCSKLSAEWAAQRIKGLSLISALKNALLPQKSSEDNKQDVIKTLIDSFHYPKRGPGMMWEKVTELIQQRGAEVRMGTNCEKVFWDGNRVCAIEVSGENGTERIEGSHFISTMPIRELIAKSEPAPPEAVVEAGKALNYRDFLTVALIVDKPELFPDNWIYIHDPDVQVGRVQNFKNWSPYMVPDATKSCVGLEYFCFEGDGLWTRSDEELVKQGTREMDLLGLIQAEDVIDGAVVRMPKAYPVYDDDYNGALSTIQEFITGVDNLYLVGRNGMHKYNNQDHSMLTAMLAVENIQGANHDIWNVNADQEYHEEVREGEVDRREEMAAMEGTQPHVPIPLPANATDAIVIKAFARVHKTGLGVALGSIAGLYLFAVTAWLLLRGGPQVGARLELLGQYFYGFEVTWAGAFIGLLYGSVWGFLLGWTMAYARNFILGIYIGIIRRRAESERLRDFLYYM